METIPALPVTIVFVSVCALMQVPMTVFVGYRRLKTGIQFLDGGDQTLIQRMRAQMNFTETVPMVLLSMAAAELSGAPNLLLWIVGGGFLLGRVLHYSVLVTSGWGNGRALGMILTFVPLLVCPIFVLIESFS
ncbi:MAPEG family protein [Roseibium sp. Sym1]|uniref:MAPEG family protein n=1 Tax=Roseibium sp. Sym1 TaxID=3016006 RepID=UPI0022B41698|nr:MAPEG family protein [Roseibium sp. Sym1]